MVPSFAHLSPKTKCIAVQFTFLRQVSGLAKSLWVSTISGSSCKFSKSVSKVLKSFYSQFILVNQKPSCYHHFDWFFLKETKKTEQFCKTSIFELSQTPIFPICQVPNGYFLYNLYLLFKNWSFAKLLSFFVSVFILWEKMWEV